MGEPQELRLLCEVGGLLCALPLANVGEVMRPLPLETISGVPEFVMGITPIRGTVTPVISCAALLGIAASTPGRFVVVRADDHQVALAVDAVIGVRGLPPPSLVDLQPLLRDAHPDAVSAIEVLDPSLMLVLIDARLLPESVWASLEVAVR